MLLSDDLLLNYKRCRRRAFLDIYGNRDKQEPPSDFLLKVRQDSLTHKQAVLGIEENISNRRVSLESPLLATLPLAVDISTPSFPKYPRENWEAGARATWDLMQQGTDCIAKPVLLMPLANGVTLLSLPDLLIKEPGKSSLGNWHYIPLTIKFGKRPKADYQIISAFQAYLLTVMQDVLPDISWLILRRQGIYTVDLEKWLPVMESVLTECIETLIYQKEPEVFISRQKCSLCQWYSSCHAIAESQKHISLLPGVTPNRYRDLQDLGITTVASLSQTDISIMAPVFGIDIANDLVQQAKATFENRAILRQKPSHSLKPHLRTSLIADNLPQSNPNYPERETMEPFPDPEAFPTASVELYFDIEAQPDLEVDYLLGILAIDRSTNTEKFYPLFAEKPENQALIWQEFLALVSQYPSAPIFHFSEYEVDTVKRLAKLYHTPSSQLKTLLPRFVDVHQQVMSTVMLPVESYSLKHLARWLGFEWRDAGVTGSQCVCLYDRWLATGDRSIIDIIQRYNEDDCRATYHLKTWLWDFWRKALLVLSAPSPLEVRAVPSSLLVEGVPSPLTTPGG